MMWEITIAINKSLVRFSFSKIIFIWTHCVVTNVVIKIYKIVF